MKRLISMILKVVKPQKKLDLLNLRRKSTVDAEKYNSDEKNVTTFLISDSEDDSVKPEYYSYIDEMKKIAEQSHSWSEKEKYEHIENLVMGEMERRMNSDPIYMERVLRGWGRGGEKNQMKYYRKFGRVIGRLNAQKFYDSKRSKN